MDANARARRLPFAVAAVALVLALTACAAGGDYPTATASTLQHAVLDVAAKASANDYAGALERLTVLERANDAALDKGTIGSARHDAIARSIATIRGDLTRLQAAAEKAALQEQIRQLQEQQQQQEQKPKGPKDGADGNRGPGKKDGGP